MNTTIVYFGLAHVLPIGTRRWRFAVAATLVATVGFTRVALGVHYLVDVVAGIAVGATLLAVARQFMRRLPADRVSVTFGLAIGFGLFFVAASDRHLDALLVLGASLGAFAGWQLIMLGRQLAVLDRTPDAFRSAAVRGGLAAAVIAPLLAAPAVFALRPAYGLSGLVGVAAAGVVVIPVLRYSDSVRELGETLRP